MNINQSLNEYLENLANQCPAGLNKEEIMDHFYNVILDTTIDNLGLEQLQELKTISPESPEMEEKIMEFASTIPNLLPQIEKKLLEDTEYIKQNCKLPETSQ